MASCSFSSARLYTTNRARRWTLTPVKICSRILPCRDGKSPLLEWLDPFGSNEPQGATSTGDVACDGAYHSLDYRQSRADVRFAPRKRTSSDATGMSA